MLNAKSWESWRVRKASAEGLGRIIEAKLGERRGELNDEQRVELDAWCAASKRSEVYPLTPREVLREVSGAVAVFELSEAQQARVRRTVSRKLRGKRAIARVEAHRIAFDAAAALVLRTPRLRESFEARIALRGVAL